MSRFTEHGEVPREHEITTGINRQPTLAPLWVFFGKAGCIIEQNVLSTLRQFHGPQRTYLVPAEGSELLVF